MLTFKQSFSTVFISEGEPARLGDAYDLGGGKFAVVGDNPPQTFVSVGMPWPRQIMCYKPRRNVTPFTVPMILPMHVEMDRRGFR